MAYKELNQTHEFEGGASAKTEALQWMKAKQRGSLFDDGGQNLALGEEALSAVAPNVKRKHLLAIENGNAEEEEEDKGNEEAKPASSGRGRNKTDPDVEEADMLSDVGKSANKGLAIKRVQKMIKLLGGVIKSSSKPAGLQKALDDLIKLKKQGEKARLEGIKNQLFEAALAIKRAKK